MKARRAQETITNFQQQGVIITAAMEKIVKSSARSAKINSVASNLKKSKMHCSARRVTWGR